MTISETFTELAITMTDLSSKLCEHCGAKFPTQRELNIHKAKAHASKEAEEMRYPCSRCGEVLSSPKHQAEHMKTEHPEVVQRINLIYWAIIILLILIALGQLFF